MSTPLGALKWLLVLITAAEVQAVYGLKVTHLLSASLVYGGGMCLMEAVRLQVKDVEIMSCETA